MTYQTGEKKIMHVKEFLDDSKKLNNTQLEQKYKDTFPNGIPFTLEKDTIGNLLEAVEKEPEITFGTANLLKQPTTSVPIALALRFGLFENEQCSCDQIYRLGLINEHFYGSLFDAFRVEGLEDEPFFHFLNNNDIPKIYLLACIRYVNGETYMSDIIEWITITLQFQPKKTLQVFQKIFNSFNELKDELIQENTEHQDIISNFYLDDLQKVATVGTFIGTDGCPSNSILQPLIAQALHCGWLDVLQEDSEQYRIWRRENDIPYCRNSFKYYKNTYRDSLCCKKPLEYFSEPVLQWLEKL